MQNPADGANNSSPAAMPISPTFENINPHGPVVPVGVINPLVKYYNDMVQYTKPTQIVSQCAEISFINTGTSTMIINGISFLPGNGIAFDGNANELDTTLYTLMFSGAGQNICFVVRKCYN